MRKSVPREGQAGRLRHFYFVHCIKGESTVSQVPENEAGSTLAEKKRRGGKKRGTRERKGKGRRKEPTHRN